MVGICRQYLCARIALQFHTCTKVCDFNDVLSRVAVFDRIGCIQHRVSVAVGLCDVLLSFWRLLCKLRVNVRTCRNDIGRSFLRVLNLFLLRGSLPCS